MPRLLRLWYKDSMGRERSLRFLEEGSNFQRSGCRVTVITGRNGSHKSTILRNLVSALAIPSYESALQLLNPSIGGNHVLCVSGAVADRFPSKETPGNRSTEFDVPNYGYLGQRVGPNLLSKRRPLETAITFALDAAVSDRFTARFFRQAFAYAGVAPDLRILLQPKRTRKSNARGHRLLDLLQSASRGEELPRESGVRTSKEMALFLIEEFHHDTFLEVENWLAAGARKIKAAISPAGIAVSANLSAEALRLALLSDHATLIDAEVRPPQLSEEYSIFDLQHTMLDESFSKPSTKGAFSVFDLSSGEYHMLTTLLGLGFGVRKDTVVLIDEPENSLHPQWQQDLMTKLLEISELVPDGHIVISTHSPLIVSAAGAASIVDLNLDDASEPVANVFGASANDILLDQFGIVSSRDPQVIDIVQRAVELVEAGQLDSLDFQQLEPKLSAIREALPLGDPLEEVLDALLNEEV